MIMNVFGVRDLTSSFHPLRSLLDHRSQHVGCDQGEGLWVAGRIHTQLSVRATCFLHLQRSLWCSREASRLGNMNCGLHRLFEAQSVYMQTSFVWAHSIKSVARAVLCVSTLLFMVCVLRQPGAERTKQRQTQPFLVLYWTWHAEVWNLKIRDAVLEECVEQAVVGWEVYFTSFKKNDTNTGEMLQIPGKENRLYCTETPPPLFPPPCCWSYVWCNISKISRLIGVKHLSSDNSSSLFLPAMMMLLLQKKSGLPLCQ